MKTNVRIYLICVLIGLLVICFNYFGIEQRHMKKELTDTSKRVKRSVITVRNKTRMFQNPPCPIMVDVGNKSLSKPPHYPDQGTGVPVDFSGSFDTSTFDRTCDVVSSLAAIVPVYSAVENIQRRTAIRETIGHRCKRFQCKVIFVIGYSRNETLMQILKHEYDTFSDILIVRKIDTYRDLNDKAIAMLDWILEFCTKARHVIHFVDDTYANVELFIKDLDSYSEDDVIYGNVDRGIVPVRLNGNKYYVPVDEYPYSVYPDFAIGACYSFPNRLTKTLRCAATRAIYIWLEDVWLMGHVRLQADIKVIHTNRLVEPYQGQIRFNVINEYLFIHSINVDDFYRIYERVRETEKEA